MREIRIILSMIALAAIGACNPTEDPAGPGGDDDDVGGDDDTAFDPDDCTDECDAPGDLVCAQAPDNGLWICSDYDADTCLEWGGYTDCPTGEVCVDGACVSDCTDECTTVGEQTCTAQLDGYVTCGEYDSDPCLEWSATTPCGSDQICESGQCVDECAEEWEDCEEDEDCCDEDNFHCCPVLHVCVDNWWQ